MTREQIMSYIPESKHGAIYDAWQDSDGIWIMLNEGWNADRTDYPCRTIHEDCIRDLRYQIAGINRLAHVHVGQHIKIFDNGFLRSHITPQWTYGCTGTVIRLNDQSVSIRLDSHSPGEVVRVNYYDVKPFP